MNQSNLLPLHQSDFNGGSTVQLIVVKFLSSSLWPVIPVTIGSLQPLFPPSLKNTRSYDLQTMHVILVLLPVTSNEISVDRVNMLPSLSTTLQ